MPLTYLQNANAHILYEFAPGHECDAWSDMVNRYDDRKVGSAHAELSKLFTPEFWKREKAVIASAPGRGESLFLRPSLLDKGSEQLEDHASQQEEWVLRPYRRGGAIARINRQRYLWMGVEHTRAFKEMRLTTYLREQGLNVPRLLGACVWRHGLMYEASLLSVRIPGAHPLANLLEKPSPTLLHAVGRVIYQAHQLGLDHVDLNARNILIDENQTPWIIDLDRCRLRSHGKWKENNLARLGRSLEKFSPGNGDTLLEEIEAGYTTG